MSRVSIVLNLLAFLLLTALAVFLHVKVLPIFIVVMEGWGGSFHVIARWAIAIGSWGWLIFLVLGITILWSLFKGSEISRQVVLPASVLLIAVLLIIQSALFVDFAIKMPVGFVRTHAAHQ